MPKATHAQRRDARSFRRAFRQLRLRQTKEVLQLVHQLQGLQQEHARQRRELAFEYNIAPRLPRLVTLPLALAGMWIVYSRLFVNHNSDLPPALDAERRTFASERAGVLSCYVDRTAKGRPLVLLHAINAAGSAYEVRPLFNHFRRTRPVYALDLPGFGFSERTDRVYSPELYVNAILALLETQISDGAPADVVALSLASEFAAAAAQARPDLVRSLALISPSGFTARARRQTSQQAAQSGWADVAYRVLAFPVWAQALYDLLATKASIRYFLRQSFEGPVPQDLIDYDYLTTHRPGARFAPLYFVSGKLFRPDIREAVYEKLTVPVLALYDYDAFVGFDDLPGTLERCPNWRAARIVPTRGLPHWEKLADTVAALEKFWGSM